MLAALRAQTFDRYYQYAIEFETAVERIAFSKIDFGVQLGTYEKYSQALVMYRVVKVESAYTYSVIRMTKFSEKSEINIISKPLPKDVIVKMNALPTISDTLAAITALKGPRSGTGAPTVYYTYDNSAKKWLSASLPDVSSFYETKESKAIFEFFELVRNKSDEK